MSKREAHCSCGRLGLSCVGDPLRVSMCHCLACQRRTGSVFGVQAWFPRTAVTILLGAPKSYLRRADSGRRITFNFCPDCGGTVFWEAEDHPELIAVAVGAFADPAFDAPRHAVWEKRRHPWTVSLRSQSMTHSDV